MPKQQTLTELGEAEFAVRARALAFELATNSLKTATISITRFEKQGADIGHQVETLAKMITLAKDLDPLLCIPGQPGLREGVLKLLVSNKTRESKRLQDVLTQLQVARDVKKKVLEELKNFD